VQLRAEDLAGRLWNMVGFQTNLKWGEQQRVFRLIPGLAQASFVRLGVMHRNTFLASPHLLHNTLHFKEQPRLLACGQLVGTEGYTAAVAGGWLAGTNAARHYDNCRQTFPTDAPEFWYSAGHRTEDSQ
jgi:methylenetetrahydrofolate--tRNA-(uracil-5-)-methyltransferase